MNARVKRVLMVSVGWGFILLGLVGLVLPVLQGVLFLLVGLVILSSEYVWAHHLLTRIERRFPGIARTASEAAARASSWLRRLSRQRKPD